MHPERFFNGVKVYSFAVFTFTFAAKTGRDRMRIADIIQKE